MRVAESQSRMAGSYEFDRKFRESDLVRIPRIPLDIISNWKDIVYADDSWVPIDFIDMYGRVLAASSPEDDIAGYDEIKDTVQCLVDAGYQQGYNSFYISKFPEDNALWDIGRTLGFLSWTMSFSIQTSYSMTVCHMDHNFELVNGAKVRRGGFLKDFYNRKILIALEDSRPGQAFYIGSQAWHNWKAGDAVILKNGMPHFGHNFNEHDRIFLMISGIVESTWDNANGC